MPEPDLTPSDEPRSEPGAGGRGGGGGDEAAKAEKKTKKRGCLGCLGKAAVVALVLALPALWLINGPVFRLVANKVAASQLEKLGLVGEPPEIGGTIWSGPVVEGGALHRLDGGSGPVATLNLSGFSLAYDLAKLARERDLFSFTDHLYLRGLKLELDLPEKPTDEEEDEEEDPADGGGGGFDFDQLWRLVGTDYAFEDLNVVIRKGGKVTRVEGLTLTLPPDGRGRLSVDRVALPSGKEFTDIATDVTVTDGRELAVGPLEVTEGVVVESLAVRRDGAPLLAADLDAAGGRLQLRFTAPGVIHGELVEGSPDIGELLDGLGIEAPVDLTVDALALDAERGSDGWSRWTATLALELSDFVVLAKRESDGSPPAVGDPEVGDAPPKPDPLKLQLPRLHATFAGDLRDADTWELNADAVLRDIVTPANGDPVATVTELGLDASAAGGEAQVDVDVAATAGGQPQLTVRATSVLDPEALARSPVDVEYSLDVPDPAEFAPVVAKFEVGGGVTGRGTVSIDGERRLAGGEGQIRLTGLTYKGASAGGADVGYRVESPGVVAGDVSLTLSELNSLTVEGTVDLGAKAYDASVRGSVQPDEVLAALLEVAGFENELAGEVSLAATAAGTFGGGIPTGEFDLGGSGLAIGGGQPLDLAAEGDYQPDRVSADLLRFATGSLVFAARGGFAERRIAFDELSVREGETVLAQGTLSIPFDPATVKGAASFFEQDEEVAIAIGGGELPIAELARIADAESPVSGFVTAMLNLSGPPRALAGDGSLSVRDLNVTALGDVPPAQVEVGFTVADAQLEAGATVNHPELAPLTASATFPFRPAEWTTGEVDVKFEPLSAKAELAESPLGPLLRYAPAVRMADGSLRFDAAASGTLSDLTLDGSARLDLPELRLVNPSAPLVKDGVVAVRMEGREVIIDEFSALAAGGKIDVGGRVGLPGGGVPAEIDISLNAEEALVMRDPSLSVRTDAALTLTGPLDSATLAGELGITNSRFVKDFELIQLKLPGGKSALPDVGSGGARAKRRPPDISVKFEPVDGWNLDVRLRTKDPFLVKSNLAHGRVVTDLAVTGTGAAPVIDGQVQIEEMALVLPFSRVEIEGGTVAFDRSTGVDGRLAVNGEAQAGSTDVGIQIYGTVFEPRYVLTSSPPLPEEDILTLLATGATRSDLTGGDGTTAASKAALLALQQIRPGSRSSAGGGKRPVSDFIEERMTFDVGKSDRKTGEHNISGSLRLWKKLSFEAQMDTEGDYRTGLKYFFEFR